MVWGVREAGGQIYCSKREEIKWYGDIQVVLGDMVTRVGTNDAKYEYDQAAHGVER